MVDTHTLRAKKGTTKSYTSTTYVVVAKQFSLLKKGLQWEFDASLFILCEKQSPHRVLGLYRS